MKKTIRFTVCCIFSLVLVFGSSCSSMHVVTHDQGNHKGWYKNPNNPHHPATTKTTGKPKTK